MNQNPIDLLREALVSLDIVSPTTFSFGGQMFNGQGNPGTMERAPEQPHKPVIDQLAQVLYSSVYAQRFDGVVPMPPAIQDPGGDLTEALSQANASRERWEPNWQVTQVFPSGQVLAQRNDAVRDLWPGEFITHDGPGVPPRVGAAITLFVPRESRTMQPGFYFAFGETQDDQLEIYETIRFYWNVSDTGAADLVQAITRHLNRFLMPFRFKVLSRRTLFSRLDSAVLYVSKRYHHLASEVLVAVYHTMHPYLAPETPVFTRILAPGLAFAEDPGTGESFGGFCCRLVAEGIWNAYLQGAQDVGTRLEAIKNQFESSGIDFDRPYLRPGSADIYEFPVY